MPLRGKYFLVGIIFFSLSFIFVQQRILGQTNNNFLSYDNPNFGIKIKYPSNWAKEESNDEFSKDVIFLVPTSPKKYAEKLSISILDAEHNKSLDQIANELIDFNKHKNTALRDYQVIESIPITVKNNNVHRIVFTYNDSIFGDVKGMLVEILKGDKNYELLYTSEPEKYDQILPTIQKMIDSFEITK
jgi:eukaryotic-like serine/threonine-protein kinase